MFFLKHPQTNLLLGAFAKDWEPYARQAQDQVFDLVAINTKTYEHDDPTNHSSTTKTKAKDQTPKSATDHGWQLHLEQFEKATSLYEPKT